MKKEMKKALPVADLRPRVFVGLSGGVDSSVSAALLKGAGYDVTGVFIKVWHPEWFECNWREDRRDAMRVCARLDIPFLTLGLEKEYKREVVDYMIAEYRAGRTPNPDVMCNKHIKFGSFLRFARRKGARFIATGHYARKKEYRMTNNEYRYELMAGKDKNKDQSYFLWTLTQDVLRQTLFPVGHLTKPEVRKLAKKFSLPTAEKKDSQGLCFIGKIDIKDFLSRFIKPRAGKVLDTAGKVIGEHDGSFFLTIGERHGFRVHHERAQSRPLYIVAKDMPRNTITVSERNSGATESFASRVVKLDSVNWIGEEPKASKIYSVRFRYREKLQRTYVERKGSRWSLRLLKPTLAAAAGQSAVVYDAGACMGGGIIASPLA
ncbi:tRNA 2-thiouridine(34) synthase MnmA [Patescibacteria group bacterium]|nr:MAG: tRNA 2-thiouridine(34) synthase MnmA [Patescibacteria group bacterium]